jgi:hypothetical protein
MFECTKDTRSETAGVSCLGQLERMEAALWLAETSDDIEEDERLETHRNSIGRAPK